MQQGLFFAGVLGFDGPAAVRTQATAGWGPAGGANPLPIVVYTGDDQGNCDIVEGIGAGVDCYLWYDNDLFNQSSFGFLNLCTDTDPCSQGWDVGAGPSCPNVGASLRQDWIDGTWTGGPNEMNWPATTFVCRVSGLSTSNWNSSKNRIGDDLIFPVNDCNTQVDKNGNPIGCNTERGARQVQHHRLHRAAARCVLDSKPPSGRGLRQLCRPRVNMTPTIAGHRSRRLRCRACGLPERRHLERRALRRAGKPRSLQRSIHSRFDPEHERLDWIGNTADNVKFNWDGSTVPCGRPAEQLERRRASRCTTVEVQFGGSTDPG